MVFWTQAEKLRWDELTDPEMRRVFIDPSIGAPWLRPDCAGRGREAGRCGLTGENEHNKQCSAAVHNRDVSSSKTDLSVVDEASSFSDQHLDPHRGLSPLAPPFERGNGSMELLETRREPILLLGMLTDCRYRLGARLAGAWRPQSQVTVARTPTALTTSVSATNRTRNVALRK